MTNKKLLPISIAVTAFLAGGIMLGSMATSAHRQGGEFGPGGIGHKGEIAAQVLGVDEEVLKEARQDGVSMEELVSQYGYETLDDFRDAVEERLVENWTEDGLSEGEIEDRLTEMAERQERREAIEQLREDLLGMSREEFQQARGDGQTMEEIVGQAGYDSIQEFHEAFEQAVQEAGWDIPAHGRRGFSHHGPGRF